MHVFLDCFIVKSADPDKALYIDVNFLVILLNDTKAWVKMFYWRKVFCI